MQPTVKIEEFLRRVCAALELNDIPYMVTGSVASKEWMKVSPSDRQAQDAAGILTVQQENLDLAYIHKWVEVLELQEQWQAIRELAG